MTTMVGYGEWWVGGGGAVGITMRHMFHSPVHADSNAASRRRHWKLIIYYTVWHNVDEDTMTSSVHGGMWNDGDMAGVVYRLLFNPPTDSLASVASKK